MKKNISDLPILRHYDKLLVVGALVVLLVSLAYLIMAGMAREKDVADYDRAMDGLKPSKDAAEVAPISMTPYTKAEDVLAKPFQVSTIVRTNANFLAPERRLACTNEACTKLVSIEAKTCPFCGVEQPDPTKITKPPATAGEVPDEIKRAYNLPINDAGVETQDLGDGFTLLEKWYWFRYELLTDLKARPSYATKLVLKEFKGRKLPLRFTAVNKMPDGNQLTLNWTAPRNPRTYWVKEGQPIGETGFTAGKLEEKFVKVTEPVEMLKDVSTVTITRDADGKEIELQIGELEKNTDVEAILEFLVDGSELKLLEKQEFKLRDETYRVVSINEKDATVVVAATEGEQEKTVVGREPNSFERKLPNELPAESDKESEKEVEKEVEKEP
ncbi:MAG: hypothetical protein FWH21_03645 [Kiritimatiellaeota bacterium]|nr:hypothetical protein [Kiritimatiellota bacterium]